MDSSTLGQARIGASWMESRIVRRVGHTGALHAGVGGSTRHRNRIKFFAGPDIATVFVDSMVNRLCNLPRGRLLPLARI
jgi:hypothetical protein